MKIMRALSLPVTRILLADAEMMNGRRQACYTSGTSGRPKGVVYHHRGAYLMSMGTATGWPLPQHHLSLCCADVPHCNGWCHAWTMTMMAATTVLIRDQCRGYFRGHWHPQVTHFGGAPIVLSLLVNAPEEMRPQLDYKVRVFTACAPPAAILQKMAEMDFDVMQVYGLTETYGHVTQCVWREDWDDLAFDEQAYLQSWQGVSFHAMSAAGNEYRDWRAGPAGW